MNTTKKIYAMVTQYYGQRRMEVFENVQELIEAADSEAVSGGSAGKGESFKVMAFDVAGDYDWEQDGKTLTITVIDEDGDECEQELEPAQTQNIRYYNIHEVDGMWVDDDGMEFETEEEALEANSLREGLIF